MENAERHLEVVCPSCRSSDVKWWKIHKRRHRYRCQSCRHRFSLGLPRRSPAENCDASEYAKDIWDIRNLSSIGKDSVTITSHYKLDFRSIKQIWLRTGVKKYIRFSLATVAFRTGVQRLNAVKHFSRFLFESYPSIRDSDINREVVVNFLSYLAGLSLSGRSRQAIIYNLRVFFEQSTINSWLDLPRNFLLIHPEDLPPRQKTAPRFIPEEVLEQLNEHIGELPPPVMRMFLVLQETGVRISELCLMPFDCLRQDAAGDWWLTYYQYKMRKDHTVTISKELAGAIQEQQKYVRDTFGEKYSYLFCANGVGASKGHGVGQRFCIIDGHFKPVAKPPSSPFLARVLNHLAERHEIRTHGGDLWKFQAHQFRHSVGTAMVNRGVPIHIVSRFLGHETLSMTQVYAHIHDPTLKKEIAKFQEKIVDVAGRVIEQDPNSELEDAEHRWFKKNVLAQALPNGSCALPVHLNQCPHANSCLTCGHFRTTAEHLTSHKEQLAQTEQLLDKARRSGWKRQVEMNEQVAHNLQKIIHSLEAKDDA